MKMPGILKGLLLLCVFSIAEGHNSEPPHAPVRETGEFFCHHSQYWSQSLDNPKHPGLVGRSFVKDVTFSRPFSWKPVVFLSVTYLDSDKSTNLRMIAKVDNISQSGFRALCFTWADTIIYEMRITWLAL
ncbi:hypothetical protein BsWGS_23642 [Bradybaena similaris]